MSERAKCLRSNRCGFTLIEAMLAVAILLLGVVAMLFTMTQGVTGVKQNTMLMQARMFASQQLESLRNMPYNTIQNLAASSAFPDADANGVSDGWADLPGATGTVWACNYNPITGACGPAEDANLRRVGVTVRLGTGRTIRLVTVISNTQ